MRNPDPDKCVDFQTLYQELVDDQTRTRRICEDVRGSVRNGLNGPPPVVGAAATNCVLPLCYPDVMARRSKRSVSLPPDLADAIDNAAIREGTSFSGWLARVAAARLRLDAGQRAITDWELDHGPLTPKERTDGRARARALLGRPKLSRPTRRSA